MLDFANTGAQAAQVLQYGEGMREAKEAMHRGDIESFRRALIGTAEREGLTTYEELLAIDATLALAFRLAVEKGLEHPDLHPE